MKKIIASFAFVAIMTLVMSLGGTVFAAKSGVSECATMSKGKCISMCAKDMDRGVSQCATASCQMTGCQ